MQSGNFSNDEFFYFSDLKAILTAINSMPSDWDDYITYKQTPQIFKEFRMWLLFSILVNKRKIVAIPNSDWEHLQTSLSTHFQNYSKKQIIDAADKQYFSYFPDSDSEETEETKCIAYRSEKIEISDEYNELKYRYYINSQEDGVTYIPIKNWIFILLLMFFIVVVSTTIFSVLRYNCISYYGLVTKDYFSNTILNSCPWKYDDLGNYYIFHVQRYA